MSQTNKSQSEHLVETTREDIIVTLEEDQRDKDNTEITQIEIDKTKQNNPDMPVDKMEVNDDTSHSKEESFLLDSPKEENNDITDIPLSEDQPTEDYVDVDQENRRNWKPEACPETYLGCILTIPRVLISIAVGIPLGLVPGLLQALGVILITLFRYPANFYKTFKVTIFTVLFKKRLKVPYRISWTLILFWIMLLML